MKHYVITDLDKQRARAILRLIKRRCGTTSPVWCICRKDDDGMIRRAIVYPDYILRKLTPTIKRLSKLYTGVLYNNINLTVK